MADQRFLSPQNDRIAGRKAGRGIAVADTTKPSIHGHDADAVRVRPAHMVAKDARTLRLFPAEHDDGIAVRHDPPVLQPDHPVGEPQYLGDVVAHHEGRGSELPVEALHLILQLPPHIRIERGKRLVQHQDVGPARQRPDQCEPLLLPARKTGRIGVRQSLQPDEFEQASDLRRIVIAADGVFDVAPHRHVRKQRIVLKHEADRTATNRNHPPRRGVAPEHPADPDISPIGPCQPRKYSQECRLARAGRPDQRDERSLADIDRDVEIEPPGRAVESDLR